MSPCLMVLNSYPGLSFMMRICSSNCFFLITVLLFTTQSCSKQSSISTHLRIEEIDSLVIRGLETYRERPTNAIEYLRLAGDEYYAIDSFHKAGNAFLNVAGIFEEHTKHADSALIFARMSLENFQASADSMQIANLNKYYGYLLGTNGSITEGEKYISQARDYYRRV